MNLVHLHLALNHVPALGAVFGLVLLAFAAVKKSRELTRVSLGVFVLVALLTAPAYLTGEPSEDAVENLPGVSKPTIEQHETAAGVAFGGVAVLGVAGLVGLLRSRGNRAIPGWLRPSVLTLALVASGLMFLTANLGGQIRHTEIRSGATAPQSPASKGEHD